MKMSTFLQLWFFIGQVIAIVDTTLVGNRTIRHSQCEILILADEVRCIKCHEYRKRSTQIQLTLAVMPTIVF